MYAVTGGESCSIIVPMLVADAAALVHRITEGELT